MIEIRRLGPGDSLAYRAVRLESLKCDPHCFGTSYEDECDKPKLDYETYIEESDGDHVVYGAFDGPELIGLTAWSRFTRIKLRHRAKIGQVYLRAVYRGQGISKRLMKAVMTISTVIQKSRR